MYTASVTVNLNPNGLFSKPAQFHYGTATSTNITDYLGSATISLPSGMHSGTAAKTYITVTQLDGGSTSRGRLSFSYSVAANCQSATIYFRDVSGTLANSTSISVSYIIIQDQS